MKFSVLVGSGLGKIRTVPISPSSDNVDEDARVSIYAVMEVLKSMGPNLGRPYVDSVKGSRHENMKELRVQSKGRGI